MLTLTCKQSCYKATGGCGESAAHGERSYASVKVLARLRVNGESTGNDDDKAAELRGKQPKVVVKVATQRLKPLRGGERGHFL
jgi:hypothetical protein